MKRASLAAALCLVFGSAAAQQGDGTMFSTRINVWKPNKVEATAERIAALKAPQGFTVSAFATGLKNARIIAVAPNGDVYLSRRDQGDVLLLRDANGDGCSWPTSSRTAAWANSRCCSATCPIRASTRTAPWPSAPTACCT